MSIRIIAIRHAKPLSEGYADDSLRPLSEEGKEMQKQLTIKLRDAVPRFLQTWLGGLFSRKTSIVLTSIVFALFHFSYSQGLSNVEFIAALFVLSCFLGYIYERQGSLWAPIGLHVFFNTISVLTIVLA